MVCELVTCARLIGHVNGHVDRSGLSFQIIHWTLTLRTWLSGLVVGQLLFWAVGLSASVVVHTYAPAF